MRTICGGSSAPPAQPVIAADIGSSARPEWLDQCHREKGMLAFGLRRPEGMATLIDVPIRPVVPFEQLRREAVSVAVGPPKIPAASSDHLIAMKTGTGRDKDKVDIEELRKLKAGRTP